MARQIQNPQRPGFAALARMGHHFNATALGALMLALVTLGSVALRARAGVLEGIAAWAQARQQDGDARMLRELAQADPRVMADLIALQQHTQP